MKKRGGVTSGRANAHETERKTSPLSPGEGSPRTRTHSSPLSRGEGPGVREPESHQNTSRHPSPPRRLGLRGPSRIAGPGVREHGAAPSAKKRHPLPFGAGGRGVGSTRTRTHPVTPLPWGGAGGWGVHAPERKTSPLSPGEGPGEGSPRTRTHPVTPLPYLLTHQIRACPRLPAGSGYPALSPLRTPCRRMLRSVQTTPPIPHAGGGE